ncbi:Uncharacterised protein [Achromobacter xylosoxidans]|nr:Uncharacterised protein [Achromobacter xylosoxidans]CUJ64825.1 Uncharacterised protein [Achromobacter xylosoxidans]CUJ73199.1 Uncharacterised protein [Achromobacter xylosoxidans]
MSVMVARTGVPCSPNTSHSVTGLAPHAGSDRPRFFRRSCNLGLATPACEMPVRSPLTSAMKTGVPMREKDSASTCRVTVLPVPVAPVIQPWRLARAGNRASSVWAFLAMTMGLGMDCSPDRNDSDAQV